MGFWTKFKEFFALMPDGVRARDDKGRYIADDKSTENVNEAYKDGKTPVSKTKSTTKSVKRGRGRPKGSKNKRK